VKTLVVAGAGIKSDLSNITNIWQETLEKCNVVMASRTHFTTVWAIAS
jgi:hypothetical protein